MSEYKPLYDEEPPSYKTLYGAPKQDDMTDDKHSRTKKADCNGCNVCCQICETCSPILLPILTFICAVLGS